MTQLVAGHATVAGTADYAAKHPAVKGHYRSPQGLTLSSIGLGSYLGETGPAAEQAYEEAALVALNSGINVLDTAANYRDQASERDLGRGIARFMSSGGARDEFLVASKAGFLHGDVHEMDSNAWFRTEYQSGANPVLRKGDVVSSHSLAPRFVAHQLARSRRNLGLDCIDIYFLHNPEGQLSAGVPEPEFYAKVEAAFEVLERATDAGHIQMYGVATWDGLRTPPDQLGHLSLVKLVHHAGQARMKVGGKAGDHHFKALQLPVNLGMTEAALKATQGWKFGQSTVLECARDLGLLVLSSASMLQMRMAGRIPAEYRQAFGTSNDAETAMQFTRSVPGITTALVGMGRPEHAKANAAFATLRSPEPAIVKTLLGTGSVHGW